jgi:hypothetical protein
MPEFRIMVAQVIPQRVDGVERERVQVMITGEIEAPDAHCALVDFAEFQDRTSTHDPENDEPARGSD